MQRRQPKPSLKVHEQLQVEIELRESTKKRYAIYMLCNLVHLFSMLKNSEGESTRSSDQGSKCVGYVLSRDLVIKDGTLLQCTLPLRCEVYTTVCVV